MLKRRWHDELSTCRSRHKAKACNGVIAVLSISRCAYITSDRCVNTCDAFITRTTRLLLGTLCDARGEERRAEGKTKKMIPMALMMGEIVMIVSADHGL